MSLSPLNKTSSFSAPHNYSLCTHWNQTEITIIIYLMYLLHYTWVKWNGFLAHTSSLICSQNPTNCAISYFGEHIYVNRSYSSIVKDLKFDWSIHVTWKRRAYNSLVQQHESWQILQLLSFLIPVGAGSLFSFIVLFWVIFYSYLQTFFKIDVLLKTFHNSQEMLVSEFDFNQPVAWYFFNQRLRHRCFLVNFAKLSRTPFLQTTLGLLLLYLLNISVISPNLVFSPKWLFQPFETLINIEMYTCEIKITWTWEFILFLHFWFCKFVIKCG